MDSRRTALAAVATLAGLVIATAGCSSSDDADADAGQPGGTSTAAAAASGAASTATAALRHLVPKDFAESIAQAGVVVLDVRTPAEYAQGHLENARNIDVQSSAFDEQIAGLDKSASYALYCRSGVRSANAATAMFAAGFTKVVDLAGGFTAWTAAGNQVTTS